jgi:hypothetical protein
VRRVRSCCDTRGSEPLRQRVHLGMLAMREKIQPSTHHALLWMN